jgi:hypothetical protein
LVDGSVSEDPVEPRDERFLRHVVHALEVSRKRILENVLCSFPAAGTAFEEAEEGTVILDEQLHASVIELAVRRVFVRFGSHPASIGIEAAAATTAKTRGSLSTGREEARCRRALGTSTSVAQQNGQGQQAPEHTVTAADAVVAKTSANAAANPKVFFIVVPKPCSWRTIRHATEKRRASSRLEGQARDAPLTLKLT